VKELRARFKNQIKFVRPGYPRYVKGADSKGTEIPQMPEPTPPMRIPLKANVSGRYGKELWMCCRDEPTILPNGLWDMGRERAISIKESLTVDLEKDIELAFFLYFKSPFMNPKKGARGSGQLKVDDPDADARILGETEEMITERKMAVWKLLREDKLHLLARAYGINNVDGKASPVLRSELEKQLEINDQLRKSNPAVKGTLDFLEEMKVTDEVLLRAFVKRMLDEKRLVWKPDGRFTIGDKVVVQVPANDLKRNFDFLCQYLAAGNSLDKLQEFLRDLLSPEYLDGITEKKEWQWLSKVSGFSPEFKKMEDVQNRVRQFYCPATQ